MIRLPKGASFIYAVARILTANDTILEGQGVVPDIEIPLDRESLLKGIDPQLEAAVHCLQMDQPNYVSAKPQATLYLN